MVFPPSSYGKLRLKQFAKKVFNRARINRVRTTDFAKFLRFSESGDLKMHHESHVGAQVRVD
jgi:hypothetical protein